MLILSRRENEVVLIDGGRISIMVTFIGDGFVKLGIKAPKDVSVHRAEVQRRIESEGERRNDIH